MLPAQTPAQTGKGRDPYPRIRETEQSPKGTGRQILPGDVIYPVLTPLALDPGHPFPHISNLSLNLAIVIRDPKGNEKFARLKVPGTLPRLIPIKRSSGATRKDGTIPITTTSSGSNRSSPQTSALFPGMEIVSVHPFRIVRDADVEIQELEADDLLEPCSKASANASSARWPRWRVRRPCPMISATCWSITWRSKQPMYVQRNHPLGLVNLWQLYNSVERHDLKYPVYKPRIPKALQRETAERYL
jgi:polyphosphate kinase